MDIRYTYNLKIIVIHSHNKLHIFFNYFTPNHIFNSLSEHNNNKKFVYLKIYNETMYYYLIITEVGSSLHKGIFLIQTLKLNLGNQYL